MEQKILKVNLPDGWEQVTIEQFQEINALSTESIYRTIDTISILSNIDPEEIKLIDLNHFKTIVDSIHWLATLPEDANYKPIITIDGIEYGFIDRISKLTLGDWMDLEVYLNDNVKNMHNIFAILYRPLVVAYNDRDRLLDDTENVEERAELFKQKMTIGDVYGALVFFCLVVKNSTTTINKYFQNQLMTTNEFSVNLSKNVKKGWLMNKLKITKTKNGIGTNLLMPWQKEILQKWKTYLN